MITSGFFNSVDGDRKYNAETITTYFEGLVSDGVYENVDNKLMVTASTTGRSVIVQSGRALVKLHWIKNDSNLTLNIDANLTSNPRYDAVVIRWNKNTRDVTISIKKGVTENYTPISTTTIKELVLAIVTVHPNVERIIQANVNDTRGTGKCPWVTGLIEQVDTSQLFEQYKSAFNEYYGEMTTQFTEWFNSLTKELSVPCKLTESKQHKDITNITNSVIIPAERYKSGDILTVIVDNLVMCEGTDYTLNAVETGTRIDFTPALAPGKELDTVVLKSVIDESAEVRILQNASELIDEKTADLNYDIQLHKMDITNPHRVTKNQIGLSNVENKSSAEIIDEITRDDITEALGYTPLGTTAQNVGNWNRGVFLNNGVITPCSYELGTNVPYDAQFTDTTYDVATETANGLMSYADKKKLNSITPAQNVGTWNRGVFFQNGVATPMSFELGASVPWDAKFTDTTYDIATVNTDGLLSKDDKAKLNSIETGAEVNQNAFSTVMVNATSGQPTQLNAGSKTSSVGFVAGSNVTLTADTDRRNIVINSTDTVHNAFSTIDINPNTQGYAQINASIPEENFVIKTGGELNVSVDATKRQMYFTSTDEKVKQTELSGDSSHSLLMAESLGTDTKTEGTNKSQHLTFNPRYGMLNVTNAQGAKGSVTANLDGNAYSASRDGNGNIINSTYATKDELREVELFKFPNATIIGTPTINNGQVSGFSASNYMKFPFVVDMQSRPFAIDIAFTTGSNVTNQQNILDGADHGIAFAIKNGKFVIVLGSKSGEWDISNGEKASSIAVSPNTTYRVRISWSGTVYKFEYSTNGETYTEDTAMRINSSLSLYPTQVFIGITSGLAGVFTGIINMNYCSLTISGKVVWTGMDDVGLATRMAVDMSNIDEAGVEKVKEIVSADYATKNEVACNILKTTVGETRNTGGITTTVISPNTIITSGTATANPALVSFTTFVAKAKTVYRISAFVNQNDEKWSIRLTTESRIIAQISSDFPTTAFVLENDTEIHVFIRYSYGETANSELKLQLELGDAAHDFVPYTGDKGVINQEVAELRSKSEILYDNSTGISTGTTGITSEITLSDSPSTYDYFKIIGICNANTHLIEVPYPLSGRYSNGNSISTYPRPGQAGQNTVEIINTMFEFDDTNKTVKMMISIAGEIASNGTSSATTVSSRTFTIRKVVGYKI